MSSSSVRAQAPAGTNFQGYEPSVDDPRDHKFTDIVDMLTPMEALPPDLDLRTSGLLGEVREQGAQGSCVAQAAAGAMEYFFGASAPLSAQCVYDQRAGAAARMSPRDALGVLLAAGIPLAAEASQRSDDTRQPPDAAVVRSAATRRLAGYWRVQTVDECRLALYEMGPVLFAVSRYEHAMAPERFWMPGTSDAAPAGGHAMLFVGYDDARRAFLVRNSWGAAWNGDGHALMPYTDFGAVREAWAMVPRPQLASPGGSLTTPGKSVSACPRQTCPACPSCPAAPTCPKCATLPTPLYYALMVLASTVVAALLLLMGAALRRGL